MKPGKIVDRRTFIGLAGGATLATIASPYIIKAAPRAGVLHLSDVRKDVLAFCAARQDKEGPFGAYRKSAGQRTDLYSSLDMALARRIMGEDLTRTLSAAQREQWIGHINSFASNDFGKATDGSYFDTNGHSSLHANGMVIGGLSVLGGKQKFPVKLYDAFNAVDKVVPWLESLNWAEQWQASHKFWGGMICYSFSKQCTQAWFDKVFGWLDTNLDPQTGWWRKDVPHADRHQPLGGSVHILPLYEHYNHPFPYPEKVIDSVLKLQLPNGRWLETTDTNIMHYLELDALYALYLMKKRAPGYRAADIQKTVDIYSKAVLTYYAEKKNDLYAMHPHMVLAAVGTFGLLQRLNPAVFIDDIAWSDIFSDRKLHLTRDVEVF
ncbi:MAG TPA: hypothetical protein VGM41_04535 [Chitinophagaceae bacterium]|jgi:hypothetical protein